MDAEKPKRGRKPLAPEERARRGRKKRAEALLAEKRTQDAPPLHISFVCTDDSVAESQTTETTTINPMIITDVMQPRITAPPTTTNVCERNSRKMKSLVLDESDSDEETQVLQRPKLNVSHVTSERIIKLLCAHTTIDKWPESTYVCCWNCTEPFEGIPLAVPGGLEKYSSRFKDCTGVFCSFNCMRRYVLNSNRHTTWAQLELIHVLHKRLIGFKTSIPLAASCHVLKKFGGYMNIDEYRKDFITLPPNNDMYDPRKRRDKIEILEKNCIPLFRNAFHTHNKHHITDSVMFDRENGKSGYDRTRPLARSQELVDSMNMTVN